MDTGIRGSEWMSVITGPPPSHVPKTIAIGIQVAFR